MRTRELCGRTVPSLEGPAPKTITFCKIPADDVSEKYFCKIEIPAEQQAEERTYLLELKVKLQDPL
jgi:hypothetical protein